MAPKPSQAATDRFFRWSAVVVNLVYAFLWVPAAGLMRQLISAGETEISSWLASAGLIAVVCLLIALVIKLSAHGAIVRLAGERDIAGRPFLFVTWIAVAALVSVLAVVLLMAQGVDLTKPRLWPIVGWTLLAALLVFLLGRAMIPPDTSGAARRRPLICANLAIALSLLFAGGGLFLWQGPLFAVLWQPTNGDGQIASIGIAIAWSLMGGTWLWLAGQLGFVVEGHFFRKEWRSRAAFWASSVCAIGAPTGALFLMRAFA